MRDEELAIERLAQRSPLAVTRCGDANGPLLDLATVRNAARRRGLACEGGGSSDDRPLLTNGWNLSHLPYGTGGTEAGLLHLSHLLLQVGHAAVPVDARTERRRMLRDCLA